MKYYINGWTENRSYFMQLGRFTQNEIARMIAGEVIKKGNNEYWIEV